MKNAILKIQQGKETGDVEVHLNWVVREDISEVTLRLRLNQKNQLCKGMTERVSD